MEFPYLVGKRVVDRNRSVLVGFCLREVNHAAVELRDAQRLALVPSSGRRQAQLRNQKCISIFARLQCSQQRPNVIVVEGTSLYTSPSAGRGHKKFAFRFNELAMPL